MKFGNFQFPIAAIRRATASSSTRPCARRAVGRAGIDVVWLGEHHFDGICAYADPITLAGALAIALKRSARSASRYCRPAASPDPLAEQIAIIDN